MSSWQETRHFVSKTIKKNMNQIEFQTFWKYDCALMYVSQVQRNGNGNEYLGIQIPKSLNLYSHRTGGGDA